jgi:hypothetical protein
MLRNHSTLRNITSLENDPGAQTLLTGRGLNRQTSRRGWWKTLVTEANQGGTSITDVA